jgi:hypothetical protein
MAETCFRVGDWVQVGTSTILPVGRIGKIVRSFVGEDDLYDVQFDDGGAPQLTLSCELEPIDRVDEVVPMLGVKAKRLGRPRARRTRV